MKVINQHINLFDYIWKVSNWPNDIEKSLRVSKDMWEIELFKNNGFMEIELRLNNSYDYQKKYQFNFTIYDINNKNSFDSEGFTFNGIRNFTTGRIKIFKIKKLIKRSIIKNENDGFNLKIEVNSRVFPMCHYINDIKNMIDNKCRKDILAEGYYEWIFNDEYDNSIPNNVNELIMSNEFKIGGYKWHLQLRKNDKNENVLGLVNNSIEDTNNSSSYACTKFVFVLRKNSKIKNESIAKNEDNIIKYLTTSSFEYFTKDSNIKERNEFINEFDLKKKLIVGVYIRIYNDNETNIKKDYYIDNLEKKIEDDKEHVIVEEGYHEWEIYDWRNTYNDDDGSDDYIVRNSGSHFRIGDYKWNISFNHVDEEDNHYISLYLNYDEDNYEDVDANYVFSIHKYSSYEKYKLKASNDFSSFSRDKNCYGFESFTDNSEWAKYTGRNDNRIVITAYIRIYRKQGEEPRFRNIDGQLAKILSDNEQLNKILEKNKLLNVKKDDYIIVIDRDTVPGYSLGYILGRSESKGLIPNSIIDFVNN